MKLGRRSLCIRCDGDASAGKRRFQLREISAIGPRVVGYLCEDCGAILEDGDVLTFADHADDYSQRTHCERLTPGRAS